LAVTFAKDNNTTITENITYFQTRNLHWCTYYVHQCRFLVFRFSCNSSI